MVTIAVLAPHGGQVSWYGQDCPVSPTLGKPGRIRVPEPPSGQPGFYEEEGAHITVEHKTVV